jgi:microcystin-dependent protein
MSIPPETRAEQVRRAVEAIPMAPITRREALRIGGALVLAPSLLAACQDWTSPLEPNEVGNEPGDGTLAVGGGSEPFLAQIGIASFDFAPRGWAMCNGQLMPINQNQALFALLGTTYGGNGQTNFALPNLRGRVPIHRGSGHVLGEQAGTTSVTITQQQMPQHLHLFTASNANGNSSSPLSNILGAANGMYSPALDRMLDPGTEEEFLLDAVSIAVPSFGSSVSAGDLTPLAPGSVTSVGGSQPHTNMMPYLSLNFCIALQGIFPSMN